MSADSRAHIEMEIVEAAELILAYIVRGKSLPGATTFVTPDDAPQQVGFVVYPAGSAIARHVHVPVERHLTRTSEVLYLIKGRAEVDIYDEARTLVSTHELRQGDMVVMLAGGHGFRLLEDAIFLEVKQGPYSGLEEKERF